jgi:hypothetical protein
MKNLITYEDFSSIEENLKLGRPGSEVNTPIISKIVSNGIITYTDSKGKTFSKPVEEDFQQMANGVMDPSQSNQESSLNTDPNRTVGTGTYNPVSPADHNVKTKAGSDTTDSASGGSHPVYVS